MEIKVEGVDKVVQSIRGLATSLDDIPTMQKISERYVAVTSALAPRRTGFLANSIRPSTRPNAAGAEATARYAAAVNYGVPARNMPPTLFMQKADAILQQEVLDLVEAGVDTLIEKEGLEP